MEEDALMKAIRLLMPMSMGLLMIAGLAALVYGAEEASGKMPDSWTAAEPLPGGVGFYGTAQCPGDPDSIYVMGGRYSGGLYTDTVRRYDAISDTWETLASLPGTRAFLASTCYEGRIYAVGGISESSVLRNTMYIYDIAADTWVTGTALSHNVAAATLGAWDDHLYLIGGSYVPLPSLLPQTKVDRYDIEAETWEIDWGAEMPTATLASGVQAGQFVYLVGGYTSGGPGSNSNAAMRYDMANDEWLLGPYSDSRRAALGVAATEQYLYAIGGDANGGGFWDAAPLVQRLDWTIWPSGTWEIVDPLPFGVLGNTSGACTMALAGGEVWSVGGAFGDNVYTSTNIYLPAEPCYKWIHVNLPLIVGN
jgi:hypothetical protein